RGDFAFGSAKKYLSRLRFTKFDLYRHRRTNHTEADRYGAPLSCWFFLRDVSIFSTAFGLFRNIDKFTYAEIVEQVRVEQFRRADISFADQLGQPRHGQLQLFWVGPFRHEQAALRHSWRSRVSSEPDFQDWRSWRIALQQQSQQLQQQFGIAHRHRQRQDLFVFLGCGFLA